MMWPFKWKLSTCTYTWCYLFFKILQNEICKLTRNLPLASFGSETVKTPSQPIICRTGPSFSKAGYHVFLDKSLANTEHNKKMIILILVQGTVIYLVDTTIHLFEQLVPNMLQVKINFRLKFVSLVWFSVYFVS